MSSQYDAIGSRYGNWKHTPIPLYAEIPTVRGLLHGLVEGRRILDIACGTGFYSRLLKEMGAAHVTAVDISDAMVTEARAIESQDPVGIEYGIGNAETLPVLGRFDVVSAMYLLHYAETAEDMHRMCLNMAANLKPGGHLVALLPDADYVVGRGDTKRYGFSIRSVASDRDWFLVHADVHTTPPFSLEYRHWARRIYEEALRAARFHNLQWRPFEISADGMSRCGADYWSSFLENPLSVALTAALPESTGGQFASLNKAIQ
jgi:SAM-dependent methyltransferase